MGFGKSAIRRIGFLEGWERTYTDDGLYSDMDDISCSITILCNFLIAFLTPFYYTTFLKNRKSNNFPPGQKFLDQICISLLFPSIFCSLNVFCFITECIVFMDLPQTSSPRMNLVIQIIRNIVKITIKCLFAVNTKAFNYFLFLFSSLLRFFIIFLAIQRFIIIYLPKRFHFLISPCFLRICIGFVWIISLFYKFVAFLGLYMSLTRRVSQNMVSQYNFVNYVVLGSLTLASGIYIALFVDLYRLPRVEKWNRPEVALLYEGIPLLIANVFITYFITADITSPDFYKHYMNYEMRSCVISAALVQFTYVFSFKRITKFLGILESKLLTIGASVSPTFVPQAVDMTTGV